MTPTEQLELARRIAVRFGKHRFRAEIDDLVQDGVVRMLEATPFEPAPGRNELRYYGWQARCGMVDGLRRDTGWDKRRRVPFLARIDYDLPEIEEALSAPPVQDVPHDARQLRARVLRAISTLPARERRIVLLYFYGDLTMRAIGRRFGVNESRISQLLARARAMLRDALTEGDACE